MMTSNNPKKVNTLGDWAYIAVEKHFNKTIKYEEEVLKDKDPEALHQMRVGMRRLRTAATGFAPALDLPPAAQERQVGKIARTLGELRDLDVLKEALENKYRPALPKSEQKVTDTALDYLATKRSDTFKLVKRTLEGKSNYQKLKQAFQDWFKEPKYQLTAQLPILEVLPDLLLPEISEFLLHPGWLVGIETNETAIKPKANLSIQEVEEQLNQQGEMLHDLRKQAKRVRYQMELFTNFYGETFAAYCQDVKKVQEVLGNIQDSMVLGEFLTEALQIEKEKLPETLSKELAESRYQAWQEWQVLQARYLNSQVRQGFHKELLQPQGLPD
ncbi:CHAD domain-containing protein [Floridanema evergladense]|uniref:CHAD domain-containing protein n=1 Tax=Floridaenema evergladense BLCC-F167 TaxID=3153639 RepID=A0ABV4WGH7_9CYAN